MQNPKFEANVVTWIRKRCLLIEGKGPPTTHGKSELGFGMRAGPKLTRCPRRSSKMKLRPRLILRASTTSSSLELQVSLSSSGRTGPLSETYPLLDTDEGAGLASPPFYCHVKQGIVHDV